jgi:ribosomal protein S18 acetylase RimI-like enzyme
MADNHSDIDLRAATPDDVQAIVRFTIDAGGGIFEQLLDGLVPSLGVTDLLALLVTDEQSVLNFRNCVVAVDRSAVCGAALTYPASEYGVPAQAAGLVSEERLEPLRAIFKTSVQNSYYLNTLAVLPEYAGRGIGTTLLQTAGALAEQSGFPEISLQVWAQNHRARNLYERFGFRSVSTIPVGTSRHFRYYGPMLLMTASSADLSRMSTDENPE